MKSLLKEKILHSGIIFTALSFIAGMGNLIFLRINGTALKESGEFGAFGQTLAFVGMLGLPLNMASTAVIHHIAHFGGAKNEAQLRGLLAGCRAFLLKLTIIVCVLGVVLIKPLSRAFEIPRPSLTIAALVTLIIAMWSGYAGALAQGMGWFKRLAVINMGVITVKIVFVWIVTRQHPVAETSLYGFGAGTLVTLTVFFWWKDLFQPGERLSPWNRDFFRYLAVAVAGVGGGWCFAQCDMLVVGNYFSLADKDAYIGAARIASALHLAVSPLLLVLFTARSGERAGKKLTGPLGLLVLYAAGLAGGALVLYFARNLFVRIIFGQPFPEASAMIPRLAMTMIFVGLIQALGMWALASHWLKVGFLYGVLGVVYWATLLGVAYKATPTVSHTAISTPGSGMIALSFHSEHATGYRILSKLSPNAPFTELEWTTNRNYSFDLGTNAAPHAFKVVPTLAPSRLLNTMPIIAGIGFFVMFIAWIVVLRRSRTRVDSRLNVTGGGSPSGLR
jgi:O-antigen/teichoic acid export membrane protein